MSKSWKESLKNRRYDPHKHCIVCGRAIPMEQDFCSTECKDQYTKTDKSRNKKNTIQFVVIAVVMVVMIVVLPLLTGGG